MLVRVQSSPSVSTVKLGIKTFWGWSLYNYAEEFLFIYIYINNLGIKGLMLTVFSKSILPRSPINIVYFEIKILTMKKLIFN